MYSIILTVFMISSTGGSVGLSVTTLGSFNSPSICQQVAQKLTKNYSNNYANAVASCVQVKDKP